MNINIVWPYFCVWNWSLNLIKHWAEFPFKWTEKVIVDCRTWQCWLRSFQTRGTKLERFLPKNQHTQRKLLNFENWVYGEASKSAKIWLSKLIYHVKNHPNLSQFFFSVKNISLEHIFCYWHFMITSFYKMMLNFWQLPIGLFHLHSR